MIQTWFDKLSSNVEQVIVGKHEEVRRVVATLLTGGHVLLEDVPGTGKTTLARALAKSLGLEFRRVQFTPDLLPSDLTGVYVFRQGEFEFRPGPLFTGLLLADELNRATPKTQSALLEAMAEGQVTLEGHTHPLPRPFLVIATQNPIEQEGTYRLPEAQLDRFTARVRLGYPEGESEREMLRRMRQASPLDGLGPVTTAEAVLEAQRAVRKVRVSPEMEDYLLEVVAATRKAQGVVLGASPRAALALERFAQALAALEGRDYVIPDDLKDAVFPVLGHRLILAYEARLEGLTPESVLHVILERVPVPVES
ncbi:Denitrification regulatory protein NirQ [Calidithermus terrae]|uniref:Denitrification regulatory protein NirQ n=1 Tax=Calidithermus terrae TaxID=1408545 RepID=A0A399EMN2_9DEIN|nr:MoxR family ATPase [Calidithermus terrae]RIH83722.1 Denitrification regulatory protein NirQ [Calidithermus terrae]